MTEPELLLPPDPATVARLRAIAERRLSAEEFEASLRAPMTEEDRQEKLSLIAWFMRRYPTPAERLASARRAYMQWARSLPLEG